MNERSLIRASAPRRMTRPVMTYAVGAVGAIVAFIVYPADLVTKAHIALHGLCAQRPGHTLWMGNAALPMDARMTGIYLGAATTAVWLLVSRRGRATGRLNRSTIAVLAGFVLVMAFDGGNALLTDLGLAHPYEPANWLRLATGALAGVTMGVALVHLFANSIWTRPRRTSQLVSGLPELLPPLVVTTALGILASSGLPILYAPLAVGLLLATVFVMSTLCAILVALITDRAWRFERYDQLAPLAMQGSLVAVMIMAVLSAARFLGERALLIPDLT